MLPLDCISTSPLLLNVPLMCTMSPPPNIHIPEPGVPVALFVNIGEMVLVVGFPIINKPATYSSPPGLIVNVWLPANATVTPALICRVPPLNIVVSPIIISPSTATRVPVIGPAISVWALGMLIKLMSVSMIIIRDLCFDIIFFPLLLLLLIINMFNTLRIQFCLYSLLLEYRLTR